MSSSLNGTGVTFSDGTILNSNGVNVQQFDVGGSTTWTKPTDGKVMCRIQLWGGGGGGGRGSTSSGGGGGGGGAYNEVTVPLAYLDSQTVVIGAAGVGRTGSAGTATAGGNSSVAFNSTGQAALGKTNIYAYGGGPGGNGGGASGTGGGQFSAGVLYSGINVGASPMIYAGAYGGDSLGASNMGNIWGGGGGSGGLPGSALFGGAGGNGGSTAITTGFGVSVWGGSANYRAAGSTPGGGGGGGYAANINGYNGGAGRIIITCW